MKKAMNRKTVIIIAAAVVLLVILGISCVCQVPTGSTGILTTFGKVEDYTLEAGFHFKSPVQEVVLMDNREQKKSFTTQAFSSDIQQVDIVGSLNYAINKSTAMTLYREVGTDYFDKLIKPRLLENTKAVFSQYTAENLVSAREQLSTQIKENLSIEMDKYGITIVSMSIENLDFTDAFTDAVEAKQVAAQRKLQAEIEQEQKTMETRQAAERQKIEADAKATVARTEADAAAYAIKVKAEAEADANKKVAESLTDSFIEYTEIKGWNGELPEVVVGDTGNMLPVININTENKAE